MKGPRPTGLCWYQARRLIQTPVSSCVSPEKGLVSLNQGQAGQEGERTLPLTVAEGAGQNRHLRARGHLPQSAGCTQSALQPVPLPQPPSATPEQGQGQGWGRALPHPVRPGVLPPCPHLTCCGTSVWSPCWVGRAPLPGEAASPPPARLTPCGGVFWMGGIRARPLPRDVLPSPRCPSARAGAVQQPGLAPSAELDGVGESTAMPTGCHVRVVFRALAGASEGDFLKMFRVCTRMEWPRAARTCTQARSRRHEAARKGKEGEKMRCEVAPQPGRWEMPWFPHCVGRRGRGRCRSPPSVPGSIGLLRRAGTLAKRLQLFCPRGRQPCLLPSTRSHSHAGERLGGASTEWGPLKQGSAGGSQKAGHKLLVSGRVAGEQRAPMPLPVAPQGPVHGASPSCWAALPALARSTPLTPPDSPMVPAQERPLEHEAGARQGSQRHL